MTQLLRKAVASKIVQNFSKKECLSVDQLAGAIRVGASSPGVRVELQLSLKHLSSPNESKDILYKKCGGIVASFPTDELVPGVSISPPDSKVPYLCFHLDHRDFSRDTVRSILAPNFVNQELANAVLKENIIVEFSSPNIAKPFHVGHLRSTIHGGFIANLSAFLGHQVTRLNYLGDWGTQFGLLQYGLNQNWIPLEDINKNPIAKLLEIYIRANAEAEKSPSVAEEARSLFQKLESGEDPSLRKTWSDIKKHTVAELTKTYARLGIRFDEFHWESQYGIKDLSAVLEQLKSLGLLVQTAEGKQVVYLTEQRAATLVKSDGSSLYLSRDLAAALDRFRRFRFDRMLYVVEKAQSDHFTALKTILTKMGCQWAADSGVQHVAFGRIQGMSTRRGTAVLLNDLLDEAHSRMKANQLASPNTRVDVSASPEVTDRLAVSSVIVHDLKQRRMRDYAFRWEDVLQDKGDTAVRLHYTHSRLFSLERKCGVQLPNFDEGVDADQLEELASEVAALMSTAQPIELVQLIRDMARFRQVLHDSHDQLEACILVRYLFDLSHSISQALKTVQVKNQLVKTARARLVIFCASKRILDMGMRILGIEPLCEM